MNAFFKKDLLAHPAVLTAIGAVVVIALGSVIYYVFATRTPQSMTMAPEMGPITEVVTGSGSVEPSQNPDLSFVSGGRVASVSATVGQQVGQGQLLASLDTSDLSAQRLEAQANLQAQEAKLAALQAGPRQVDVTAAQTAVSQAQLSLSNLYGTVPQVVTSAHDTTASDVSNDTDALFSQSNSPTPTLVFSTSQSQAAVNAENERVSLGSDLTTWASQAAALSASDDEPTLDQALTTSITHLGVARDYANALLTALNSAVPSPSFPQASITASQVQVAALLSTVNGLVNSLQALQQQLSSAKLAVQSAQDALNQTNAGSLPQDIQAQQAQVASAQASVDAANAQISDQEVVAPFSGTVASVNVKAGQTIAPNTIAVSLTPHSALQVPIYLSEVDAAKVAAGQQASVTLDAYGLSQTFPAVVATIDASPSTDPATQSSGYKAVLQFQQDNPLVKTGMTAHATIVVEQKAQTLQVPLTALLQNGNMYFVLVKTPQGSQQRQVTIGAQSTSSVEITSGLTTSDQVLVTGK